MNREDKKVAIQEAMDLLAEAEQIISSLDDDSLEAYVAGHINARGIYIGEGLYQILEKALRELEGEEVECGKAP